MGDLRQGVTPAGHAVLDRADKARAPFVDSTSLLFAAARYVDRARDFAGLDLASRRGDAVHAAALLLLAIEALDEEERS